MPPPPVPPDPAASEVVSTEGPGDPTVGAGIADTRGVVTSHAPIVSAAHESGLAPAKRPARRTSAYPGTAANDVPGALFG